MSIQAVIFDMYETLVTQFCSPLYYGTQIAGDLGLRPEEWESEPLPSEQEKGEEQKEAYADEILEKLESGEINLLGK